MINCFLSCVPGAQHHCHIHHQSLGVRSALLLLQPPPGSLHVHDEEVGVGPLPLPALPPDEVRVAGGLHVQHPRHHLQQIRHDCSPNYIPQVKQMIILFQNILLKGNMHHKYDVTLKDAFNVTAMVASIYL